MHSLSHTANESQTFGLSQPFRAQKSGPIFPRLTSTKSAEVIMHQQISIISIHIYCTQAWVGLSSKHNNLTTTTHLANGLGISQLNLSAFISMTREFLKNPCIYSSSWLAKIFSLIFLAGIRSQGSQRHFHRSEKFPARPMPKLYIDFYLWLDFWPMKTYIVLLQKKYYLCLFMSMTFCSSGNIVGFPKKSF